MPSIKLLSGVVSSRLPKVSSFYKHGMSTLDVPIEEAGRQISDCVNSKNLTRLVRRLYSLMKNRQSRCNHSQFLLLSFR